MLSVGYSVGTETSQKLRASLPLIFLLGRMTQGFLLLGGHVGHEIYHCVAVVMSDGITENELYNFVIKNNHRPSITS